MDRTQQRFSFPFSATAFTSHLTITDLDHDGNADILLGREILMNLRRQLHTSHVARLGGVHEYQIFVEMGDSSKTKNILPMLSLGSLSRPVPILPFGAF